MNKKHFLIAFMLGFALVILIKREPTARFKKNQWVSVSKNIKDKKVSLTPARDKDLKQARLENETPAAGEEKRIEKDRLPKRLGRIIHGYEASEYLNPGKEMNFLNSYNPRWDKLYADKLLRHHNDGTRVLVKKEKSLIRNTHRGAIFVEQVKVRYLKPDGTYSGFRALVNSETGRAIETWERTLVDDWGRNPQRLTQHTTRDRD